MSSVNHASNSQRLLTALLALLMVDPSQALANSAPKPTARWIKSNYASTNGLPAGSLPTPVENALPDANPTVQVGDVVVDVDGRVMTVTQGSDRALIDWNSFNIGSSNTVTFRQPGANSVALNRIYQEAPSGIFGKLQANGNVWLFNSNGIFFGEGSQTNVRGLIASALEFNELTPENFATKALFSSIDKGKPFLTSAEALDGNGAYLPRVVVGSGAQINSGKGGPVLLAAPEVINQGEINAGEGSQVVLAGSRKDVYLAVTSKEDTDLRGFMVEVDSGRAEVNITRADGGTETVSVRRGVNETVTDSQGGEHQVIVPAGAAVNAGTVTSQFGNITLVASDVIQAGTLRSTTAVDSNGSIRLFARDGAATPSSTVAKAVPSAGKDFILQEHVDALYLDTKDEMPDTAHYAIGENAGRLTLAADSVTKVAIDSGSKTANDTLTQAASKIHLEGRQVAMGERAQVIAPGGDVTVRARVNPLQPLNIPETDSDASFTMADSATIDVSGSEDAVLDASRNTLEFFLTSNEFRDAPGQKDGALLRQTVKVDIRKGTPLFDWTTGLDSVEKTAAERTMHGGTIDIRAGSTDFAAHSVLDVSGGKAHYNAGFVESSWLLEGNRLTTIDQAQPNSQFQGLLVSSDGVVIDPKWGARESFRPGPRFNRIYREAYDWGGDAGYLSIEAGKQDYDPAFQFKADALVGPYQRSGADVPAGGVISVRVPSSVLTDMYVFDAIDAMQEDIVDDAIVLTTEQLEQSGAKKIKLQASGRLQVGSADKPVELTLNNGALADPRADLLVADADLNKADLLLIGESSVDVNATIRAPGSDVRIEQRGLTGDMEVSGSVDTSGNWSNDVLDAEGQAATRLPALNAGSITLQATANLLVEAGSRLLANAGAWLSDDEKLRVGKAGDITIANKGFDEVGNEANSSIVIADASFEAIDAGSGGTLSLQARNITFVGDGATVLADEMQIGNAFFDDSKVGGYEFVTSEGNITIESDAVIDLHHHQYQTDNIAGRDNMPELNLQQSADRADSVLPSFYVDATLDYLAAGAGLTLSAGRLNGSDASTADRGILQVEHGARIVAPPQSTVAISAQNRLLFDGSLQSAGGNLSASLQGAAQNGAPGAGNYLLIGERADINLSAQAFAIPGAGLEVQKRSVAAGSVALSSTSGEVLVQRGAQINLAGALTRSQRYLDSGIAKSQNNRAGVLVEVEEPLAAGSFTVRSTDGFVIGNAIDFGERDANGDGLADFRGGELVFSLAKSVSRASGVAEIALGQSSAFEQLQALSFGDDFAPSADGQSLAGRGRIATANVSGSHVDRLTFNTDNSEMLDKASSSLGKISMTEDVELAAASSITLDSVWLDTQGHQLSVRAPQVQLGESTELRSDIYQQTPDETLLSAGDGGGTILARVIELVGNLSIGGNQQLTLSASEAVRARSVIDGRNTTVSAIAPATLSSFGEVVLDTPVVSVATLGNYQLRAKADGDVAAASTSRVAIGNSHGSDEREPVLSFGGRLGIAADEVLIDSRIEVPSGSIDVEASQSLTLGANSVLKVGGTDGVAVPFGRTQGDSLFWTYALESGKFPFRFAADPGEGETALPAKQISLTAPTIVAAEGSEQDLAGGGEVYGREFVAGLGGSTDILSGKSYQEMFVIVPELTAGLAPYDALESAGSGIPLGLTFEISGSDQIAAGRYTVLPANYAFLDGAVLVSAINDDTPIAANYFLPTLDGAQLLAGRFGNAGGSYAASWQKFRVEPGFSRDSIDPRAEYRITRMNDYFETGIPGVRPEENGRLLLTLNADPGAAALLDFKGRILSSASVPNTVAVDLTSNRDIVVGGAPVAGSLSVNSEFAEQGSVLIGATRQWDVVARAWRYTATTDNVRFADNVEAGELVVSARNGISVDAGVTLRSREDDDARASEWLADGNAASVLLASNSDTRFSAIESGGDLGTVNIQGSLSSRGGTAAVAYDGSAPLTNVAASEGARLQIASSSIRVGGADGNVTAQQLQGADKIDLLSRGVLLFNESLAINGLQALSLTFNEASVADGQTVALYATDLQLHHSGEDAAPLAATAGSLSLRGETVALVNEQDSERSFHLGSSEFTLAGRELSVSGRVKLEGAGAVNLQSNRMVADESLVVTAAGALTVTHVDNQAVNSSTVTPGSRYDFSGASVLFDSHLQAQSGLVRITATAGDVVLGEAAQIDVSPFSISYPDGVRRAPLGQVHLQASDNVTLSNPASLLFGADTIDGSDGGSLIVKAGQRFDVGADTGELSWTAGGLDLSVQAGSLDADALQLLNSNGFDGDLDILVTGVDENFALRANDVITAHRLSLVVADGSLAIDSGADIIITSANDRSLLRGEKGLTVADGARIRQQGVDGERRKALELATGSGAVTVAVGAQLETAGNLEITAPLANTDSDVSIDGNDNIAGSIYLYLSKMFTDSTVTQADINSYAQGIIAAIANVGFDSGNWISTDKTVEARPLVDVYSSGDMLVSGAVNLATLRAGTAPGRLQLRAGGDITVNNGISDGVVLFINPATIRLTPNTPILMSGESWDISLVAGALGAASHAATGFANTGGDIRLGDAAYVRTGTGDINVNATGDVLLGTTANSKAYIASLGRADYIYDFYQAPLAAPPRPPAFNGLLPAWGDKGYHELWYALNDFSGFSEDSGDVSIAADGSLISLAASQHPAEFMQSLARDTLSLRQAFGDPFDYSGIRVRALAIKEIKGGIHNVGGGNIAITLGEDLDSVGVSTPGQAMGLTNDQAIDWLAGGNIAVQTLGDIKGGTFANDGGAIGVRSFTDVRPTGTIESPGLSLFLTGSNTHINVVAGGSLGFDGMANTTVMPLSANQVNNISILSATGMAAKTHSSLFFSGYENTSLQLSSIGGDSVYLANTDAIEQSLGSSLSQNLGTGEEYRFALLPSQFEMQSFGGDVILDQSFTLFPSPNAQLSLRAHNTIGTRGKLLDSSFYINVPDFAASVLPTSTSEVELEQINSEAIRTIINPVGVLESDLHGSELIDRGDNTTRLYAMNGSLGNQEKALTVYSPMALNAYAGQDIRNVSFAIQHDKAGRVSQLRADGSFLYDLLLTGGTIQDAETQFVEISGPGDLILSAGENIELGASAGIRSIGNTNNALLAARGADLHVLAGYSGDSSGWSRLLGRGELSIDFLRDLGIDADTATTAEIFTALAQSEDQDQQALFKTAVARATGVEGYDSSAQALEAWTQLDPLMQLRAAVYVLKEMALANPQQVVQGGSSLFASTPLGEIAPSGSERTAAFDAYWNTVAGLIALDYMLDPERIESLGSGALDTAALTGLALGDQVSTALTAVQGLDAARQFLVAERVMSQQVRQSGVEAAGNGGALAFYERGFVALQRFFGEDFARALKGASDRIDQIVSGNDAAIPAAEFTLGEVNGAPMNDFTTLLNAWQNDSGESFAIADEAGDPSRINMVFSAIRSLAPGADINLLTPNGYVDVGLSEALVRDLGLKLDVNGAVSANELGVISEYFGDVNAVVASAFNVNESRTFSLAGGAVNLWATWGDIDAGKGAKTAVSTPPVIYSVNPRSGVVSTINPPSVTGSGIKTAPRALEAPDDAAAENNFYERAPGAGPAYLATPLGVVDAGEAGIQSAGNLFIAAQQVRGADNINVGGVSVGVSTSTTVSASLASAGDAANQASDTATESVAGSASRDAVSSATAFVTIELLDTGIGIGPGPTSHADVCTDVDC